MMASVRVPVTKEILLWVIEQSDKEIEEIKSRFPIDQWMKQERKPTLKQLKNLSAHLQIPFGYFLLKSPPIEDTSLLDYRTIQTEGVTKHSRNLLHTILDMERKQDWMKEYLIDSGFRPLNFVGSIKELPIDYKNIAKKIRKILNLDKDWYRHVNTRDEAFNYLKSKVSAAGILVMQNGVALNNPHRALDVNEFRAFALIDDHAPLIFINSKDTQSGKIFSLLHEVAHIFFGQPSLYNDISYYNESAYTNRLEIHCNAIAAELLVPTDKFNKEWDILTDIEPLEYRIASLAEMFNVSQIVIARKALDEYKIEQYMYDQIVNKTLEKLKFQQKPTSEGGHFYYTAQSRLDHRFFSALANDVRDNRTLNTTAYRLTDLNRYTFEELENYIKGVNH